MKRVKWSISMVFGLVSYQLQLLVTTDLCACKTQVTYRIARLLIVLQGLHWTQDTVLHKMKKL